MNRKNLAAGAVVIFSVIWLLFTLIFLLPKRKECLQVKDREAVEQILPSHDVMITIGDAGAKVSESMETMQQVITDYEVPRQNSVTAVLEQVCELYQGDSFAGLLVVCSHGTYRGDIFYIAAALEADGRIHGIAVLPASRLSGNAGSVLTDSFLSQIIGKKVDYLGFQTSNITDGENIITTAHDSPATEAVLSCVNLSLFCYECYYCENGEEEEGFYVE